MKAWRGALALAATAGGMAAASPAAAQFYLQEYDYAAAARNAGAAPGQALPGATPVEQAAGLTWAMRSALNVAALQCQFEPTLLSVGNYNAMLVDHRDELKGAWDTLNTYFIRTAKTKKEGLAALDQFGTRTYSSFATVSSQYGFCRTASAIGRDAIFAPRGSLGEIARTRMGELRASLTPYGEQRFARRIGYAAIPTPRLDPMCWNKKGDWQPKKCGPLNWPPADAMVASAGQ